MNCLPITDRVRHNHIRSFRHILLQQDFRIIGQLRFAKPQVAHIILPIDILKALRGMLDKLLVNHRIGTLHLREGLFKMHQKGIRVQRLSHGKCHNVLMTPQDATLQSDCLIIDKGIFQHGKLIFHVLIPLFRPGANPVPRHKARFRQIFPGDRLIAPILIILEAGNMIALLLHFLAF